MDRKRLDEPAGQGQRRRQAQPRITPCRLTQAEIRQRLAALGEIEFRP